MSLVELLEQGFGNKEGYNCAEKIVYGANEAYELGIAQEDLKLAAAFGGGMGIESVCGVITGGLMVLGRKYTESVQHDSEGLRPITNEFIERFQSGLGDLDCKPLKDAHKTEELGCKKIIVEGARILDDLINKN